jgi:hypothetical protein
MQLHTHTGAVQDRTCSYTHIPGQYKTGHAVTHTYRGSTGQDMQLHTHTGAVQDRTCSYTHIPGQYKTRHAVTHTYRGSTRQDMQLHTHTGAVQDRTCSYTHIPGQYRTGHVILAWFHNIIPGLLSAVPIFPSCVTTRCQPSNHFFNCDLKRGNSRKAITQCGVHIKRPCAVSGSDRLQTVDRLSGEMVSSLSQ